MTKVQEFRERRKQTQEQLATASGVKQQTISAIENGKNKNPGILTMWRLAMALRCTVDDLVDEEAVENEKARMEA